MSKTKGNFIDHNNCVKKKIRLDDDKASSSEDFHNYKNKNDIQYLESPIKLSIDNRRYRSIKLKNGLTAFLVSHSENKKEETNLNEDFSEKMASCSLCINVGDFSDPPHIQGLAHLLEHVITMGNKKYPQENEYDAFITARWGSSTAYIEHERTTYAFQISDKYLPGALDRFAHMFIDPLISKDTISRERQAVESEFKLNQQLDVCRKEQLKHSLARLNHPASKFSWGNLITLEKNITLDKLHSELYNFWKRHYSAHRMTLAVQSSMSLDTLEEYVINYFSDVPVNHLPLDDFSMYKDIESFDPVKFRKLYYIKTIADISQIELNWEMPSMQNLYKSKPYEYINWCLRNNGEGSLFKYLCKNKWCMDIEVQENDDQSFYDTSMYYLLTFTVKLFDEGYTNYVEVLNSIFSYINFLKREGVQKDVFDHVCQVTENNYKSNFIGELDDYVEYLAQNMQYYKPADYINGYDLIYEYDPEAIQSCLNNLCPENVNIIISTKSLKESETDKTEPWFQTKYLVKEIPKEWIEYWKVVNPLPEFNLTFKKCLSTIKTLKTANTSVSAVDIPIKLHHKDVEVWYKKLADNSNSKYSMNLQIINPLFYKSVLHSTTTLMMVIIAIKHLAADIIDSVLVFPSIKGIIIENHSGKTVSPSQISKCLEELIKSPHKLNEEEFNFSKQVVFKMLYNFFIDAELLTKEICQTVVAPSYWISVEKYNALSKINFSQFLQQVKNFEQEFYVQCFVKGSVPDEEVINCVEEAIKPLRASSSLLSSYTEKTVYEFEQGERFCQIRNLNSFDLNTVVTNYYQVGHVSAETINVLELLMNMMSEPLFYILRTKEQLGYKAYCGQCYFEGIVCICISVTTQADKFTACHVDERIDNFIKYFQRILTEMPSDEFEIMKANYVRFKRQALEKHKEDIDQDWMRISTGEFLFQRENEEMEIAQNIELQDLVQYFNTYLIPGSNYRKLSVQVVGNTKLANTDEAHEEKYSFKFSTEITEEKKKQKAGCYIEDFDVFRNNILVHKNI